ncbi:LCP family protein [Cellulomonas algicola]|uniref:LCP family protein n=1 Tax=Cellulomonas algicola TaxID=2071633 RepID=UPI001F22EF06|nr:LCP family protein [Cellulomonas algicola]
MPTTRHTAAPHPRAARHARRLRSRPWLRVTAVTAVAVVAFAGTAAASLYVRLRGNVETVDTSGLVDVPLPTDTEPPDPDDPNAGRAVNLLVIGSDDRSGENGAIGGYVEGQRSDTTLLVHVSADRQRVDVVSIPRDSRVDIPACNLTGGGAIEPRRGNFNDAFALGWDHGHDLESAAACTIMTVYENTGILAEHTVIVDFSGFQGMVDAIGGVSICVPADIDADYVDLTLAAGQHHLDGPTALNFARARKGKGLGDGSDTNRIGNQQRLVAAMVDEVFAKNVLTDVPELVGFLGAATQSLTVDPALKDAMIGLAFSLRSVRAENITFLTVPFVASTEKKNKVDWTAAADTLWANVLADRPLTEAAAPPPGTDGSGGAGGEDGTGGAGGSPAGGAPTGGATSAPPDTPVPSQTRKAGREPFTVNDTTAVCA